MQTTRRHFLQFLAAGIAAAVGPVSAAPAPRPNIVLILADDLGYGDLGCYGNTKIRTPHLDRLAAQGIRFTDFYVPSPLCTPARGALLTGRYPVRNGLSGLFWPHSTDGIPDSEITLAEILKQAGYTTGLIGKWHLGHLPQFLPMRHGFDYWFGMPYPNDMDGAHPLNAVFKKDWPPLPLCRNGQVVEQPVDLPNLTRKYAQECAQFIEKSKGQPFFLFYAPAMPHTYLAASDAFRGKSAHGLYGDTVEELDWSVGQIVDALRKHGLDSNTLIFFTNDNGPVVPGQHGKGGHPEREKQFFPDGTYGSTAGLRGGKQSTFEGGVRVPAIAAGPGIPAGRVEKNPAIIMDLLPTFAAFASAKPPADRPLDGEDLSATLRGQGQRRGDEFIFFNGPRATALRSGPWKLKIEPSSKPAQEPDSILLFDLANDPGETTDLSARHPDILRRLQQRLAELQASLSS